jgi:hypothetical protein
MSRHTGPTHVVPVTVVEAHRRNERASEPGPTLSDRELDWDTLPPSDWRYEQSLRLVPPATGCSAGGWC